MSNELGLKDLFDYGKGKAATLLDDFGWAEHGNGAEPERDGEQSPPPEEPSPVTDEPATGEPDPVVPVGATAEETSVALPERSVTLSRRRWLVPRWDQRMKSSGFATRSMAPALRVQCGSLSWRIRRR